MCAPASSCWAASICEQGQYLVPSIFSYGASAGTELTSLSLLSFSCCTALPTPSLPPAPALPFCRGSELPRASGCGPCLWPSRDHWALMTRDKSRASAPPGYLGRERRVLCGTDAAWLGAGTWMREPVHTLSCGADPPATEPRSPGEQRECVRVLGQASRAGSVRSVRMGRAPGRYDWAREPEHVCMHVRGEIG